MAESKLDLPDDLISTKPSDQFWTATGNFRVLCNSGCFGAIWCFDGFDCYIRLLSGMVLEYEIVLASVRRDFILVVGF
ncbi:hypothetical protein CK203_104413 [Vitis vinifera]|uniref:Uncharacterized protein n=1 Tax=Vitis vinifera TaxID=29760 RepID=A0A438D9A7_VITVI|nr:hypothetical protein CK203_104413 [Vitis vinifera]